MTRKTYGNAGKGTVRCPSCQWENLRPPHEPGKTLVLMDCHACGHRIILRRDLWERRQHEKGGAA